MIQYLILGFRLALEIIFSSHCRYWHETSKGVITPRCEVPRRGDANRAWEFVDGWHPMDFGAFVCRRDCGPDE